MLKQITFVVLAAVGLASCGGGKSEEAGSTEIAGNISIDGSSTVFPLSEAMAEEFGLKNPKARVTVGESGTGGGFKKFGLDRIEVAVNTIKYGAFDYIVKSESAFHRSENVIFNIIKRMKLQGEARLYKKLTLLFGVCLLGFILLVVILYQMGYIAKSPGWI